MRILIEGRLQGINFRFHTQKKAQELGLVGFIRTLADGRIEIDVQGNQENVEKLLAWCQKEPQNEHIKTIFYRYDQVVERYSDFNVR